KADTERRALTAEEELTHDELLGEIKKTSDALTRLDDHATLTRTLDRMTGRAPGSDWRTGPDTVGAGLVKHEAFQEFRSRLGAGFPVTMAPIEVRAPLLSPSGGWAAGVAAPPTMPPPPPSGAV